MYLCGLIFFMIHLILFGPPGSGKGTQAVKLAEYFNLTHISTGDLFRYEIEQKSELGLKALEFMGQGQLVPDEITIGMLKKKLLSVPDTHGIIYDGFPRTIAQAKSLDSMLAEDDQQIDLLLSLEVPDEEIVKRILNRGKSSGRPDDNDESIIRTRIQVYSNETAVVFEHYAGYNKSKPINGLGSIDDIFERLCRCIDPLVVD